MRESTILLIAVIAMFFVGCDNRFSDDMPSTDQDTSLYEDIEATTEDNTRTYIDDCTIYWSENDLLSVFYRNTLNSQYIFTGESGEKYGTFTYVAAPNGVGESLNNLYALYPYREDASISSTGVITTTLPDVQRYSVDSFAAGCNTAIGVSYGDHNSVSFKNVCGYLKIQLWGEGNVKSIMLKGNNGESIAGQATIAIASDGLPEATLTDDLSQTITLNCEEGIALSNNNQTPTTFWFVLPETTFTKGISITVTDNSGAIYSKHSDKPLSISRNTIQPMAALEAIFTLPQPDNQIWYTTTDGQQITSFGGFDALIQKQEWVNNRWVITFDKTVTEVGYEAFDRKYTLMSISLPNSVTSIGTYAFYGCSNLESITMSNRLESIGELAFSDCIKLKDITLPSSIKSLAAGAFINCDSLTSITFPEGTQSIGNFAFDLCDKLVSIYTLATTPPTLGNSAFEKDKVVIYVPTIADAAYRLHPVWGQYFINGEVYSSSDYSMDGEVEILQQAKSGNGIDIVFMGDGYSDRLIEMGNYEADMRTAMDMLFSEEPYSTFRDLFNVYMVKCVSKREGVSEDNTRGNTAFNCYFKGVEIKHDEWMPYEYARKVISDRRIDNAMLIVILNSSIYGGTCYMHVPSYEYEVNSYGNGTSVSFFSTGGNQETLKQLLLHEAAGHGFAKLADEYFYESNGHISSKEYYIALELDDYGWYKNVDYAIEGSKNASNIKWRHFLEDLRYAYDGLGVFEGAYTFLTGAYRPTDISIMRHNVGGFNAPSREAIYQRIHHLAYGTSWTYNYETFVEYDAKNRKSAQQATMSSLIYSEYPHTAPPVITHRNWRDIVAEYAE